MKSNTLLPFCLFILVSSLGVTGQVGIGTTTPRGALEINSNTNGFIAPRVALESVNSSTPVKNPQDSGDPISGTLVYNTATAGTYPNNVSPGFYFWNGSAWLKISAENTADNFIDDMRVPLDKGSNSAALGPILGSPGPEIWFFRNNEGKEAMSFTAQLPHNWKEGTTIYPHIHWIPKITAPGNMKWNLDYSWANSDGTFSSITTISVVVNGSFTQNKQLMTNLTNGNTGISGTGKTISSILVCRIWRDSSDSEDTYSGDAGGLSMDFHISLKNPYVEYPQ